MYHINLLKGWREAPLPPLTVSHSCVLPSAWLHLVERFVTHPLHDPEHKRKMVQKEMAEMLKMEVIDESHITFLHYIVLEVKEVLTTAGYMKDQCPMPQVGHCTVFLLADCRVSRREKRPSPLRTAWFVTCVRLFQSPSHCSATWPRRSTCRWIKRQPSYPASIPRCRGSFGLAGYYHQFVLNFADLTKRVAQI